MADIKWIKLSTDIFNNKKIKQIESMKNGDTIVMIWIKLLALAGSVNDNGYIYITSEIPYTKQGLATELNKPLKIVEQAISLFEDYEMIEIEDGFIVISSWEKYQNTQAMEKVRNDTKERVKRYRERKRNGSVTQNVTQNVTLGNATEEEKEEEIEKEYRESVRENIALSIPPTIDDLYEFLPKAREILDEKGISFSFPLNELEPFFLRNTQYKWKGITDAESMAMAMSLWMSRADDYRLKKEGY